jgi:hypothetical protein
MKAMISIAVVIVLACAPAAFGQAAPVYDQQYTGPMNVYGQATYQPMPQQTPAQGQPQPGAGGVLPMAGNRLWDAGEYLWSYMPAPVRGADSPYTAPPGSGQVNVTFTPGPR